MRHAKSSWKNQRLSDMQRPLNHRGLADAPKMARRLAGIGFKTDLIVSSPAARAIATARIVAETIDYPLLDIRSDEDLYLADPDTLLELIASIDNTVNRVMLFGHNPGFTMLTNMIGDAHVDNMPTASIAAFDLDIDHWEKISYGCAKLRFFDYPKNTARL